MEAKCAGAVYKILNAAREFCSRKLKASSTIEVNGALAIHPSSAFALVESATRIGGSPGRLLTTSKSNLVPTTASHALIISKTE